MFFRANPTSHESDESNWISFYPWDANFIVNCADPTKCGHTRFKDR